MTISLLGSSRLLDRRAPSGALAAIALCCIACNTEPGGPLSLEAQRYALLVDAEPLPEEPLPEEPPPEEEDDDNFPPPGEAVMDRFRPLAELDRGAITEWSAADLLPAFERVRDERFLFDPARPDFPRRLTWLLPQRECDARAQLVADTLAERGYERPSKLFVSGRLRAATPNDPSGQVAWDWHVAAAVRVGDDVFVLDAAIDPRAPLGLEAWLLRLVPSLDDVRVVACGATAFDPATRCLNGTTHQTDRALGLERSAFPKEWDLQILLGRDPQQVLGEAPPWLDGAP